MKLSERLNTGNYLKCRPKNRTLEDQSNRRQLSDSKFAEILYESIFAPFFFFFCFLVVRGTVFNGYLKNAGMVIVDGRRRFGILRDGVPISVRVSHRRRRVNRADRCVAAKPSRRRGSIRLYRPCRFSPFTTPPPPHPPRVY